MDDIPELNQDLVHNILKSAWKNDSIKINKEALQLFSELLRHLVTEAVHRSSEELETMAITSQTANKNMLSVEALERILPQLLLDF